MTATQQKIRPLASWRKTHARVTTRGRATKPVENCYRLLGEVMCEMRERLGITQTDLASKLGWTRASICNIEGGKQRVMMHDLERISKVLCIPVRDLLPAQWTK